ncbi:hypothetical protein B0H19DRAFT_1233492 [Mycena capillaripes]|nr:hypothetical protein B0H19DRAFT_1233492 [Mycena capillaripes]
MMGYLKKAHPKLSEQQDTPPPSGHANKRLRGAGGPVPRTQEDESERDRSRSRSSTPETIDDPDSRPKKPLPLITPAQIHNMNTTPYAFPNPEDMTGLPTKAEENPHTQTSQRGEVPGVLPDANQLKVPFTLGIFPRVVIPYSVLTQNMAEDQIEQIDEDCLAILPWNAGPKFYKENPHANREVAKFLESLPADTSAIEVALPKAKHNPKRDFEGPWPMLLKGADEDLTKFLLWHQTFSVNAKLTFSVVCFDKEIESWVVMTISGDAVRDTPLAKAKVLGAIKRRLWHNTPFVNFVNGVLGAAGIPGSGRQRVVEATRSFSLTYVETDDQAGDHAPGFQLTAKPITSDPAQHRQWLAHIRGISGGCVAGIHALLIDKRWVNCTGCKSQMHPAHSCPLPKVPGWLGQVPDNAARHAARVEKKKGGGNSSKGKGKDKAPRSRNGLGGRSDRTLKVCILSMVELAGPPGLKRREPWWKYVFAQTDAWSKPWAASNGVDPWGLASLGCSPHLQQTTTHLTSSLKHYGNTRQTGYSGQVAPEGVLARPLATPPMMELLFSEADTRRAANGSSGETPCQGVPWARNRGPLQPVRRPVAVSDRLTVRERESEPDPCAVSAHLAVSGRLAKCEAAEYPAAGTPKQGARPREQSKRKGKPSKPPTTACGWEKRGPTAKPRSGRGANDGKKAEPQKPKGGG